MNKLILAAALSFFALSSNGAFNTIDNPLFAKGKGGAQCKNLPSTCGQMANCEQAKQALKTGP